MNENIKKLAVLAGATSCHAYKTDASGKKDVWTPDAGIELIDMDVEKFAELLIKEFLNICKKEKEAYLELRKSTMDFEEKNIYAEGESASDRIRLQTKRYFGIK